MKLLICTQAVDRNDLILGFFHDWIEEFSKHCEEVYVICLRKGDYVLPPNVHIFSIDEKKKLSRLGRAIRFLKLIFIYKAQYDTVFVHMNPEYVILGGIPWRLWKKSVGLWYTHKKVTLRLRLAVLFVGVVFTASAKSFRLPTNKLHIVGHGITTSSAREATVSKEGIRIVTVGRISPTKRLFEMLDVLDVLYTRRIPFRFTIVGTPVLEKDGVYEQALREKAAQKPYAQNVHFFIGSVLHRNLDQIWQQNDVFLNLSATGSFDKAVLEAMAGGVVPVTSNEAFAAALPAGLFIADATPERLADALQKAPAVDTASLREYVEKHHSLALLIPAILKVLQRAP